MLIPLVWHVQELESAHEQLSRMLPLQPWPAFWARAQPPKLPQGPADVALEGASTLPERVAQHAAEQILGLLGSEQLAFCSAARRFVPASGGGGAAACFGDAQLRALLHLTGEGSSWVARLFIRSVVLACLGGLMQELKTGMYDWASALFPDRRLWAGAPGSRAGSLCAALCACLPGWPCSHGAPAAREPDQDALTRRPRSHARPPDSRAGPGVLALPSSFLTTSPSLHWHLR